MVIQKTEILKQRILQLKTRATTLNRGSVSVNEYGKLEEAESLLDKRIVEGYAVIWNKPNQFREKWQKGAFTKSIRDHGPNSGSPYEIKFLYNHKADDVLGLFEILREDEIGLYFRTKPLDVVPNADRTITQIRSKSLNNFSQGFDMVWDKIEYDDTDDTLLMKEGILLEISVVGIPADMETYAMRSREENLIELYDESEDFIYSLPRKFQLQARSIIARHKSLIPPEPPKHRRTHSKNDKPTLDTGSTLKYLIKNLKP